MAEKEDTIYEVVFSYQEVDKDKRRKTVVIGPIAVPAKTERVALAKAVLKEASKLAIADLLTLDVKIRGF